MKICFLTAGTRGDVQPFLALAKELDRRGHHSVIAAGSSFREAIEKEGVSFYPASLDLMQIIRTPEGKAVSQEPIRHMKTTLKLVREVINPGYRATMDDYYTAAQGADLIVYHPKALGAVDVAVKLGIPCVSMPPAPVLYPISSFPCPAVSSYHNFGPFLNRKTYLVNRRSESAQISLINQFRHDTLGLPARKTGAYTYYREGQEIPIIYPISPSLFSDVTDWEGHVRLPGFFFLNTQDALDKKLEQFIYSGPEPVAVTFSSIALKNPHRFMDMLESAAQATGQRIVLLTGNSSIDFSGNDLIFAAEQAPHDLLFNRCCAVFHHGGAGTSAAALRAGIPQLIMPCSGDQPFWAQYLYRKGYALKPISEQALTAEKLKQHFHMLKEAGIRGQSEKIGAVLKQEHGTENAADWIITNYG